MIFLVGFLSGLIVAVLIVTVLTYFRRIIEHKINIIEKQPVGPRPRGAIYMPPSDADEARESIIARNSAK